MNLSTVLRCLQEGAPLSRARLADLTGLNKTTISSLIEELLDRALVHEVGLDTSGGGRPAIRLLLRAERERRSLPLAVSAVSSFVPV